MRNSDILLAALLYLATQSTVQAGQCLQSSSPGKLCTANDFELVSEELISGPASCVEGEMIPGDIVVRVGLLGNRVNTYDVGFFIGDGDSSPINGESCTFDSLAPIESGSNPFDGNSGAGPYRDLDSNACGDALKSDGAVFRNITLSNVLCQDNNNDGSLDVAYAITWKQNDEACDNPTDPDNFSLATTSKCIDGIGDVEDIPVLPPNPGVPAIRVEKLAEPLIISPGEDVDYTINVENEGPITVTLDSLVDDRFGDLNGLGSCAVPQVIDPGQVYTCAFNAVPTGSAPSRHINLVTGSGTGGGLPVSDTGRAVVEIVDLLSGGIGYLVWNDLDADGIKTESEPGIPGVTLNLLDGSGTFLDSRVTDESGAYAFEGLGPGNYQVEALETGALSNLVRTTAYNPFEIFLFPGQVVTEANFGYVGAQITLGKAANPQIVDAPGELVEFTVEVINTGVLAVQLTDLADDQFGNLFDSGTCTPPAAQLAPGETYICRFNEQVNGAPGDTHVNTVQAIAEDTIDGHQVFAADDALVGIEDPASSSIGDFVWLDTNGNGAVDEGEVGLDSVTLRLSYDADEDGSYETVIADTTTLNSGEYGFVGLSAGNYRIEVTDNNEILSDKYLTTPPEPLDITLSPGQVFLDADFGYAELPKPGIVVLKIPTEFVHDAPSSAVTYRVTVLNTGGTSVTITDLIDSRFGPLNALPDSTCELGQTITTRQAYKCQFTETIAGDPGEIHRNRVTAIGTDPNDNIAFDSGPAAILFVDPDDGVIGDLVWEDINADGVFNPGEPGIGNVSIELYRGPARVGTTVTDPSGNYQFSGLEAGFYQVRVTDTAGVLNGKVLTGGSEPLEINLSIGENYLDADFGYTTAAIEVVKEGDKAMLIEPGGNVTYTITTRNIGFIGVTLNSLMDDKFGDLSGQGNCTVPVSIPARSSVACQFTASISGNAGDIHTNTVTATAVDEEANPLTGQASFDVDFIAINAGAAGYLVWEDENGNGLRESSEPGIGGVTLDLEVDEDNNGTFERLVASKVTRQSGFYAFIPVPSGKWRIRVTDQYGVLLDWVLTGGSNPDSFDLAGGEVYTGANFGYFNSDDPGGVIPPPVLPPPGDSTPMAIPALPIWAILLMAVTVLGLGGYSIRRSQIA